MPGEGDLGGGLYREWELKPFDEVDAQRTRFRDVDILGDECLESCEYCHSFRAIAHAARAQLRYRRTVASLARGEEEEVELTAAGTRGLLLV